MVFANLARSEGCAKKKNRISIKEFFSLKWREISFSKENDKMRSVEEINRKSLYLKATIKIKTPFIFSIKLRS